MQYKILARSFNRKTKEPLPHYQTGLEPAEEVIDTLENPLFSECKNEEDVKSVYESFWNDVDPYSKEIVLVDSVEIL